MAIPDNAMQQEQEGEAVTQNGNPLDIPESDNVEQNITPEVPDALNGEAVTQNGNPLDIPESDNVEPNIAPQVQDALNGQMEVQEVNVHSTGFSAKAT